MPLDILSTAYFEGPQAVPGWSAAVKYGPYLLAAGAAKYYFGGATNNFGRDLHGRVFIITGGTSGLGAYVAYDLAQRGAQIVLLCRLTLDLWTVDFVEDLREKTGNFMVYAEQCDLASLHSVRMFATQWLDNQPPRRLDGVICCAADCIPRGRARQATVDGVERHLGVNYLAHAHLLTLLKPLLHVQPPDRDVRVVLVTCLSQAMAQVDASDWWWLRRVYPAARPGVVYGTSKLMAGMFARLFQRTLNAYERKDKAPCNIKVSVVNPGIMRTPLTRRFLSMGSVWGLVAYVLLWPVWFLVLKSARQGAQSVLWAILAPVLGAQDGGNLVQECGLLTKGRSEYWDYDLQDKLVADTAAYIEEVEKRSAVERKRAGLELAEEKRRKADIHAKPTTEDELDHKLNLMRKSMATPMGGPGASLFGEAPSLAKTNLGSKVGAKVGKARARKV